MAILEKIPIVVQGLPDGNMAKIISQALYNSEDFRLCDISLTGNKHPGIVTREIMPGFNVETFGQDSLALFKERLSQLDAIVIDYTSGSSIIPNTELYCATRKSFVMGTTPADDKEAIEKAKKLVASSGINAFFGANMSKQIAAFQSFINEYANKNLNSLEGFLMRIWESHQATKKAASGTAQSLIPHFNTLGIPYSKEGVLLTDLTQLVNLYTTRKIGMIREPALQMQLGVKEKYLGGHGWHSYEFLNESGTGANLAKFKDKLHEFLSDSPVFSGYEKTVMGSSVERTSPDGEGLTFRLTSNSYADLTFSHKANGRAFYLPANFEAAKALHSIRNESGRVLTMPDLIKN